MKLLAFFLIAAGACGQTEREGVLLDRIEKLERRLAALEARAATATPVASAVVKVVEATTPTAAVAAAASGANAPPALPLGTSLRFEFDGYYGFNFNRPFTRESVLRAYDTSSNSFSVNQAALIIERTPNVEKGRRIGGRLDLLFGQATETQQGSPVNELRPNVYRHIFQAYGTYIAPIGKGLTVDFGKFASSFGIEGNYAKDQLNYSRSYSFTFLPFYHTGFRTTYPVTSKLNASYWLINGINQTEDFNGLKSHAALLNYTPTSKISANVNYFNGQEQRTVNGRTPRGRTHILDSYITWQPDERLTLSGEGYYVVTRVETASEPQLATGAAGYAAYRFHPRVRLAGRFEYLNDSGRLFSGTPQALKEATATATFDLAPGFQMRWEVRRDWSNRVFFPTENPAVLKREQTTALLGLIWWFGGKQGLW